MLILNKTLNPSKMHLDQPSQHNHLDYLNIFYSKWTEWRLFLNNNKSVKHKYVIFSRQLFLISTFMHLKPKNEIFISLMISRQTFRPQTLTVFHSIFFLLLLLLSFSISFHPFVQYGDIKVIFTFEQVELLKISNLKIKSKIVFFFWLKVKP